MELFQSARTLDKDIREARARCQRQGLEWPLPPLHPPLRAADCTAVDHPLFGGSVLSYQGTLLVGRLFPASGDMQRGWVRFAARLAVRDQVDRYRCAHAKDPCAFTDDGCSTAARPPHKQERYTCRVCGKPHVMYGMHVDHVTFFHKLWSDSGTPAQLQWAHGLPQLQHAGEWADFHAKHASLRVLCRMCNLSRPLSDVEGTWTPVKGRQDKLLRGIHDLSRLRGMAKLTKLGTLLMDYSREEILRLVDEDTRVLLTEV